MIDNDFLTYQRYANKAEAAELSELLTKNNIEFIFEDTSATFDPTFANNELYKEFRIKLRRTDFQQADKIQIEVVAKQVEAVGKDYYLFEFTDQELMELIRKSDEWSKLDYLLAQKILKERGKEVNEDLLDTLRKQRIEELTKPEASQTIWIIIGYICAILGGLLGLFIGWHLSTHKKTIPNGERVFGYSGSDRKHGNRIFILGLIFLHFWTIIWILN